MYHVGFGADDIPEGPRAALLSGDPGRSEAIATTFLDNTRVLARNRGLDAFLGHLPSGVPLVCATSGMGAPSMSIVVNELFQLGIRTVIRVGTSGAIHAGVAVGSVVITSAAVSLQGAADDIAPPAFPAAADPFLTVTLAEAATALGVEYHVGVTASTDTFFEGQERTASSANPYLIRRHAGLTAELRDLGVLNFEMEAATLLKMGLVYGFAAGCVCAIIAQRTEREEPDLARKDAAVAAAVGVALDAADRWTAKPPTPVRYRA